ncbi:MAG: virB8 family protein [Rickettsiaceae bacterium]|nr:MAG: virB8 family protein [Rickettsiaceae bacterium]
MEINSQQEYIKSGKYFKDAREWYSFKYLHPLSQRSFLLLICLIYLLLLLGAAYSLNNILPLINQVRYSLSTVSYQSSANIIKADSLGNNALASIADVLVRDYIKVRESYNYDDLRKQFTYIQNSSTRIVFRKFSSYMNMDNPDSPVTRYQKYIKKSVNILSVHYPSDRTAEITFNSIAKNNSGDMFENMIWQATIDFEIDDINLNLLPNSRFNFVVTNYRLKTIKDKLSK